MAKGRRDVELVVRARNEASKAVDAVTASLDALTKAQKVTADGAGKTQSKLGELGSALGALDSKVGGASVFEKLAASSLRAADAVGKIGDKAAEAAQDQARLAGEVAKTEGEYAGLAKAVATANANLAKAKAETLAAKQAQKDYNAELRKAKAAHESAANAHEADLAKLREQQALIRSLKKQGPSNELSKQQDKLLTLQDNEFSSRIVKTLAAGQVAEVQQQLLGMEMALGRVSSAENRAARELAELSAKMGAASTNVGALRAAETAAANDADRLAQQLVEANAELGKVDATAMAADAALAKIGGTVRTKLLQGLKEGTQQLREYEAAWKAAQTEVGVQSRLLNLQTKRGASPDEIASTNGARGDAIQRAREAKVAYQEQAQALHVVRAAMRAAGTDVQALNVLFNADTDAAIRFRNALKTVQTTATATAPAQRQVGTAARETATALAQGTREVGAYEQSLNRLGRSGRDTLSMWSRIKGEVIALTLSYVGLYGAMNQLRGVADTVNKVQAAKVKLALAFGSDTKAAEEFQWLRAEADRLGLSYLELANSYAKFAVGIQKTPQLAGKARELFTPFAEAGRVLNLTTDELDGLLNAINQMVGKGKVQAEELRGQLGDRLTGAYQMMADALHLTVGELDDMIRTGAVATNTALPRLAAELEKTVGPKVQDAASNLAAQMARLENTVTDARLAFAEGGFTDGLQVSLDELNKFFKSDEGQKFFQSLGEAAGLAMKVFAGLVKNFDLVAIALGALVGIRAVSFVRELGLQFRDYSVRTGLAARTTDATTRAMAANAAGAGSLRTMMVALRASTAGVQTSMVQAGVATTAATGKFTLMRAAVVATTGAVGLLRGALAFFGGPIGLAITAVSAALGYWVTAADEATDALGRHEEALDRIRQRYQGAKDDVSAWSAETRKAAALDIQSVINKEKEGLNNLRKQPGLNPIADAFGKDTKGTVKRINELLAALRKGSISATKFKASLSDIAASDPTLNKSLVERWAALASEIGDAEAKIAKSEATLRVFNGTATDADRALAGYEKSVGTATAGTTDFNEALDKALGDAEEKFGATNAAAKKLANTLRAIDDFQSMFEKLNPGIDKTSDKYRELIALLTRARQEAQKEFLGAAVTPGLVDRIVGVESGGKADAKNPLSTATGLGQFIESTWLALFRKYFPDTAAGMTESAILALRNNADTSRKMVEAYAAENAKVLQAAGVAVNDAALYLAHFLGPGGAVKVLQAAADTPVAKILSPDQIAANKSILGNGQTAGGLQAWAQRKMGVSDGEIALNKQIEQAKEYTVAQTALNEAKAEELRIAKEKKVAEAENKQNFTVATPAQKEAEVQQKLLLELAEARRQAAEKGAVMDEKWAAAVERRVRAEVEESHALDEINAKKRAQEQAEKNLTALEQQRSTLLEAIQFAQNQGDNGTVEKLKVQLQEVNAELLKAIQSQIAYWQAAGGPEADAAIAKLKLQSQQIAAMQQVGTSFLPTAEDINKSMANALGNTAVDSFIAKLREGQDVMSALGDTIREVFADFLLQIGKAILQQAIFNALSSMGFGGKIAGAIGGLFHSGGVAGQTTNRSRAVSPMWFANAARYHGGGVAGLKPGEVPAILEEGERIRTVDQERALQERLRNAESGQGASPVNVKVVNAIDSGEFVSAGLSTVVGERAVMNFMRARKTAVKSALGI